jgi:undecaprenyl-diphosphatase
MFALANTVVSEPLDLAASFFSLLGKFETTGALTLAVSLLGWKRRGMRGLAPTLLFFGVAIEVVLKFLLPHPSLPEGYARNVEFLPHLRFSTPYSFPSGHMLRITFLAVYFTANGGLGRVAGWMLVLIMALTRLYLNEHWASDIIGGVCLGLVLAYMARTIAGHDAPR